MKDTSIIPHGDYCYIWIEVPSVNKHFGSEEETDKHLCLFLLFDGCKECGVNKYDDED